MTTTITVNTHQFTDIIGSAGKFAAKAGADMPILRSVHLRAASGWLVATATDRYRLGAFKTRLDPKPDPFSIVIPIEAVNAITRTFRQLPEPHDTLTLTIDRDVMRVSGTALFGGKHGMRVPLTMTINLDPGQYPKVTRLIVNSHTAPAGAALMTVNPQLMSDAMKAVQAARGEPVVFWPADPQSPVAIRSLDGSRLALVMGSRSAETQLPGLTSEWVDALEGTSAWEEELTR